MSIKKILILTLVFSTHFSFNRLFAQKSNTFLCTRSNDVNLRNGPATFFKIVTKITVPNFPLMIIEDIDDWVYVQTFDKKVGWISKNLTKKTCPVIIRNADPTLTIVQMFRNPSLEAKVVVKIENYAIVRTKKCYKQWCSLRLNGIFGWIERKHVWGA